MRLVIFLLILALILGIFGYFYYQKNIYSKEILKLEIEKPDEAEAFEQIEYLVKYKNNGNIRLEEPKLVFEFPKYSILEEDSERKEIILEDIYPGQEKILKFKARLLGREGETKIAKAYLSFRPKNLKAKYEVSTSKSTKIIKVPLNFNLDLPSKIESGKDLTINLNYFSNIDYPLFDLRCFIEYPLDFEFERSKPEALEKTEWEIPLLNKGEGGRIEIFGKIRGSVGEQKIFKTKIGLWKEEEFVLLKEVVKGLEIISPSLYLSQQINGNPQYIANPGDLLHYEIFFRNVGKEALTNLVLMVTLEGKAFDFSTIKAPLGEFKLGDNSILFDGEKVAKLQFLDSLEEGKVEFWIKLKKEWPFLSQKDKNPLLKSRIYLSEVREEFLTKINSKLEIFQKGYFNDKLLAEMAFGNLGPIPPKVRETTTYTILWEIKNYYNDLKNVKVRAILPDGINLTGKIYPEQEAAKFSAYELESKEIIWQIGDLSAGSGVIDKGKSLSFQIALTPKEEQKGQILTLIKETKIFGEDTWTGQILEAFATSTDTTLPDDETISREQGIVQ
jgi:hypothetical protein